MPYTDTGWNGIGSDKEAWYEVGYDAEEEHFKVWVRLWRDDRFDPAPNPQQFGLVETASLYKDWGRCLSESWEAVTGTLEIDQQIRRRKIKKNEHLPMKMAAGMLAGPVKKAHAVADGEALRGQRAAFATFGRVPTWAFTTERIEERAREYGWPDPEYAARDFRRMRWFRVALASSEEREHKKYQKLRRERGRVRKAHAQMPRGISPKTVVQATENLDTTSKPPRRRLTWIALAQRGSHHDGRYAALAEAIQRATRYELRKSLKRARELRAALENRDEEAYYIYAEEMAAEMIGWIADVYSDRDLRPTAATDLINWVERSGRYHRDLQQQQRQEVSRSVLRTSPFRTGLRPQDLPDGATARTTASEIREEGRQMGHCVGDYAGQVLKGLSMIIHYETGGDRATIEITRTHDSGWTVGQAFGPRNTNNKATREGETAVRRWLQGDPEIRPPRMDISPAKVPQNRQPLRKRVACEYGDGIDETEETGRAEWQTERVREEPPRPEPDPTLPF
jgi:hypothetical protein